MCSCQVQNNYNAHLRGMGTTGTFPAIFVTSCLFRLHQPSWEHLSAIKIMTPVAKGVRTFSQFPSFPSVPSPPNENGRVVYYLVVLILIGGNCKGRSEWLALTSVLCCTMTDSKSR